MTKEQLQDRTKQELADLAKRKGIAGAVPLRPDQPLPGDARRHTADLGADIGVAFGAGGEAVFLAVGHEPRSTSVLRI